MTRTVLLPAIFVVLAALLAAGVHSASRGRRPERDLGDVWARVLRAWGSGVALLMLLSAAIEPHAAASPPAWDGWWKSGWHLQRDRLSPDSYTAALFVPLLPWAAVLLWSATRKPGPPAEARWVAGGIGFSSSRTWLLLAGAPVALLLASSTPSLGGGEDAYPAAFWGCLATIVVTLFGLALSRGTPPAETATPAEQAAEPPPGVELVAWPAALKELGILVEPILPAERGDSAGALSGRAVASAARPLGPHAREVTECLLSSASAGRERSCLLLAPDDVGQVELVAELARTLAEQAREATLVVVPADSDALLTRLQPAIEAGVRAEVLRPSRTLGGADVWVVDADTLSDSLLPRLGGEPSLARVGLVVWWDAHAYTGVLAANMWAVSRRLDRLIRAAGREDVRTLAVTRSTPDPGAQLGRYVRRLFPYDFREVSADSPGLREVEPHRITSHAAFFDGRRDGGVPLAVRHPGWIAALASMRAGYPTHVDAPPGTSRSELEAFARLDVSGSPVKDLQRASPAAAAAAIRHLRAGDALAFQEIVRGTGRASASGDRRSPSGRAYVGIVPPSNPYARYVLSSRFPAAARAASRRLVCAESRPRIVERHLLLALSEMEDSRTNLRTTALWNEDVVRKTLERLDQEHKLRSFETRWLGKDGRLRIDRVYKSLKSLPEYVRPLDTAGTEPVLVRDVSGKDGGVRRMVDRERLPIVAYPTCVFTSGGARYEVRDWDDPERREWVECQLQDKHRVTWRRRDVRVPEIKPTAPPVRASQSGHPLVRQQADVVYEEDVRGAVALVFENGTWKEQQVDFSRPLRTGFGTQALVLELPVPPEHAALASVAQALRHVLPVHLGVEEDAIEVVPVPDGARARIAVVDLFPGGIGVVPAIAGDDDFLLTLLGHCHDWLSTCPCRTPEGCPECLRSLEAAAANPDKAHRRDAAVLALSRMVPRGAAARVGQSR